LTTTRSPEQHVPRERFNAGVQNTAASRWSRAVARGARIIRALAVAAGAVLFFAVAIVDGLRSAAYRRRTRRAVAR
jgi:hypothetical protein